MTPSAPQATLGLPQGTLWAPHGVQIDLKSRVPGGEATTPGIQNHPLGAPRVLWVLLLLSLSLFFFFRLFFCVVPAVAAVLFFLVGCRCAKFPRALDSITHAHNC